MNLNVLKTKYALSTTNTLSTNENKKSEITFTDISLFKVTELNEVAPLIAISITDKSLFHQNMLGRSSYRVMFKSTPIQAYSCTIEFKKLLSFKKLFPISDATSTDLYAHHTTTNTHSQDLYAFIGKTHNTFFILTSQNFPLMSQTSPIQRKAIDQGKLSKMDLPRMDLAVIDPDCLHCLTKVEPSINKFQPEMCKIDSLQFILPLLTIESSILTIDSPNNSIKYTAVNIISFFILVVSFFIYIYYLFTTQHTYKTPLKQDSFHKIKKPLKEQQSVVIDSENHPNQTKIQEFKSKTNIEQSTNLEVLVVSSTILGTGSHGTTVYQGTFQSRPVAVKRLLIDFHKLALHEITLLKDSDHHQNIIRYYYQETKDDFLYIALELCEASLQDVFGSNKFSRIKKELNETNVLKSITDGVLYLHSLGIIHRDIKPANILVKRANTRFVILLSDFGLWKSIVGDVTMYATVEGSVGWRSFDSLNGKASKQNDVFSCGCVFYFILSGGRHPFGKHHEREVNIMKGKSKLELVDQCAIDLIHKMILKNSKNQISIQRVSNHCFFWHANRRIAFLVDVSDRWEQECKEMSTKLGTLLERETNLIIGGGWKNVIDDRLFNENGKFRKYDFRSLRDLLRIIRNKKNHYNELEPSLKDILGPLPGEYWKYFDSKFPLLFIQVYKVIQKSPVRDEPMFENYFEGVKLD